jgi:DNA-binding response OmpR family regulator
MENMRVLRAQNDDAIRYVVSLVPIVFDIQLWLTDVYGLIDSFVKLLCDRILHAFKRFVSHVDIFSIKYEHFMRYAVILVAQNTHEVAIIEMKALVLEDDIHINELVSRQLREMGFEVFSAFDGDSALKAIELTFYELLVFDLHVPGIDGLEIMEYLKRLELTMNIIVITSDLGKNSMISSYAQGCRDYITKPFYIEELAIKVKQIFRSGYRTIKLKGGYVFEDGVLYDADSNMVKLTEKERKTLDIIVRSKGSVVCYQEIMDYVWGISSSPSMDSLRFTVKSLRQKAPGLTIKTISKQGYYLVT